MPKKKVSEEMLLAAMEDGEDYSVEGLAKSFSCAPKSIRDLFIWLIDSGKVLRLNVYPRKVYRLNPDYAAPVPEISRVRQFKPLGILDISTHQRLCEGARHNETGMV